MGPRLARVRMKRSKEDVMASVLRPSFPHLGVGAGSAGCVIARRLSEDPNTRVLLLEAGPMDHNVYIHMPAGFVRTWRTRLDWMYHTTPQRHAADRQLYWP